MVIRTIHSKLMLNINEIQWVPTLQQIQKRAIEMCGVHITKDLTMIISLPSMNEIYLNICHCNEIAHYYFMAKKEKSHVL